MYAVGIILLISGLTAISSGTIHGQCEPHQHFELGKTGIINCSFDDGLYAVVWYYSENFDAQTPLVGLVDGTKVDQGMTTEEFDIRTDGSLIINNVTFLHNSNFTALVFRSEAADPLTITVEVVVVVKPSNGFPVVDLCLNETMCYVRLEHGDEVSCHTSLSRPAVNLKWVARTSEGDMQVSTKSSIVTEDRSVFTSRAITKEVFLYSSFLSLLVCKADYIPMMLSKYESAIFIENSENNLSAIEPIVAYAERHSTLTLTCPKGKFGLLVWKKSDLKDIFQVISYAAYFEKGYSKTNSNDYILQDEGSLFVPRTELSHGGIYGCTYESDESGGMMTFDVVVYVAASPVVEGCASDQRCVLDAQKEGSLTCYVKGILPKVQLEWKTFFERESSLISFTDHQLTTTSNGDDYDVTLISKYRLEDTSTSILTIECAIQSNAKVLISSAIFDLFFASVQTTGEPVSPSKRNLLWILGIIIPICLLSMLLCLCYILKGRRRKQRRKKEEFYREEDTPMISTPSIQAERNPDMKIVFKRELKTKYKYQYDAVQPIPYIKDRLYCVDRVFVEGGFEKLISKDRIEGLGNWEKLTSYHEVTDMSSSSSTRTIIEGDPGYGKSTLTLQLAYDWCNSTAISPLAAGDILILLRLRQLGGVHSLVRAIKQFILPRDSRLNETDIQTILRESRSTVLILDGFDEYPEEETESLTDFISIIRGEMFQESFVILTTRSFFLPNSYPPQSHRIRLTGFDSKARDAYIRKAVVGDNTKAAEKIKRSLQKNSVIQGLCQVPLFFVMFAHMTHESENFIKFKSVTSFFRHMITCFHSHMKNKMKDLNVKKFDLHENDHDSLDEVAFQGLNGKNQKIVWRKADLVKRLGNEFYDQYIKIGMLVEEEVLDVTDTPGDIRYDIEVRFYHKLFCEWYAAHCLCRKVVEPDANIAKLLENMNPFDLQYTYRFACGINSEAGNKIIEYLRGIKDGDKFSVLCLLEQSGQFDQIKETVLELCSNCITIDNNGSLLLQGSIVQLLEIGSSNQIPISFVWLKDCFNSMDISSGSILLKSELSISSLPTLKELVITERGRALTKEEVSDVLEYSAMCPGLKSLRFCYLSMPKSVSKHHRSFLEQRKLQVLWCTDEGDYLLNHRSGEWEAYDSRASKNVVEGDISAKKNLLISLMKKKYNEITAAVPIVPADRDRLYNVNEIFIDSGLQYMVAKDKDESNRQWEPLHSYPNIFTDSHANCKRHVLQGNPGFGKSMIALKMAYDWCNDIPQSPLSKVDLFLLVQLTLENTSQSIYTNFKRCVLPKDSPLTDIDIRDVLRECSSAVVVLDDFNLCGYEQTDEKSDVVQIIRGKMLKNVDVIFISTFVPRQCMPGTNKLRLAGFDDKSRDEYIEKVVGNDLSNCNEIKQKLLENHIIKELFNVPLFLSTFVHMSRKNSDRVTFKTLESTFTFCMECLQSHRENREKSRSEGDHYDVENDHLDKVAFDCLCAGNNRYVLDKEIICKEVGRKCYDKYVRLGMLVETEIDNIKSASNRYRVKTRFCHKLFCLWFATHYIATDAAGRESEKIKYALKNLDKSDIERMRNFAEEVNATALCRVLCWVKQLHDFDELSKLIFEHFDQVGRIEDVVSELCSRQIEFENGEKDLLQKSRIHLLNITSEAKISISHVYLRNCYSTVNLSGGNHLQLKSNLSIPVLTTLKKLTIDEEGREITAEEFAGILQYSSKCLALKQLVFLYCLLPQSVQAESVSVLRSRNVKVFWDTSTGSPLYLLDLELQAWKRTPGGGVMTNTDFQREVNKIREIRDETSADED